MKIIEVSVIFMRGDDAGPRHSREARLGLGGDFEGAEHILGAEASEGEVVVRSPLCVGLDGHGAVAALAPALRPLNSCRRNTSLIMALRHDYDAT